MSRRVSKATGGAEGAVIISGEPASDKDAAKKAQSAVTMAAQFSKNQPLVVAGLGGGRRQPRVARCAPTRRWSSRISTVDNASTVEGQVATALATAERVVQGKVGQYGLAAGAASMVPKSAA